MPSDWKLSHFSNQYGAIDSFFRGKDIHLDPEWLRSLLTHLEGESAGQTATKTLQELAIRHFLASDLKRTTSPTTPQLASLESSPGSLRGPVVVQTVACVEVGFSVTQQLEQLERYEERQKPVNRRLMPLPLTTTEQQDDSSHGANEGSTEFTEATGSARDGSLRDGAAHRDSPGNMIEKRICRVLLEDSSGDRTFAIDQKSIPSINLGMALGSKMIVKEAQSVHGVLILKPNKVDWLGGEIREWNQGDVKARIKAQLEQQLRDLPVLDRDVVQRGQHNSLVEEEPAAAAGGEAYDFESDGEARPNDRFPTRGRARGGHGRGRGGNTRPRGRPRESRGTRGRGARS